MKRLTIVLLAPLFSVNAAWAICHTEEAVRAADQKWADTLKTHDPRAMASLYGQDSVLLGTFENIPLTTYAERVKYFTYLFETVPNIRVEYDKTYIKVMKEDAVSSGLYTFIGDDVRKGKEIRTPARYSFFYEGTDSGCTLLVHHSSGMPVQYTSESQID